MNCIVHNLFLLFIFIALKTIVYILALLKLKPGILRDGNPLHCKACAEVFLAQISYYWQAQTTLHLSK